jgi:ribonuclease R
MRKNKTKSKNRKVSAAQLQREILQIFKDNPKKRYNPKQLSKKLDLSNHKDAVLNALVKLTESGELVALEDFKFKLKRSATATGPKRLYEGYVDITRTGAAYIECEGEDDDIFVSAKNLGTALHGDLVQVAAWIPRGRRRPEGEVIGIVERATEQFVGTVSLRRDFAIVVPAQFNVPFDIGVEMEHLKNAQEGDRVVVKITQWHKRQGQRPKGVVTSVLGVDGSDLEMKIILINNGFELEFPQEVIDESEAFSADIPLYEIHRRQDFRNVTTFTIDPADAKDFDDALSMRVLENGNTEIGVHIADVTHFVKKDASLDKEAFRRSTSVYLVDRVLPMLPERLSNNLCSLRPREDRLTFSAIFEFDKNYQVVNRCFGKTIIHSDRRFSYEEAEERLQTGKGDFARELKTLNKIAKKLREERFKHGAIDFDSEEVRFKLDEQGVPVEAFVKERLDAHMLIEDFMLLANREVAQFIHRKGASELEIPFVYRIHDYPDPDKVRELAVFARELGFHMKTNTPMEIATSFNKLVSAAEENESFKLLLPLAIRTMAKAEYSTENIGHYGLSFDFYAHFTSPIRRYADVLVHRILEMNLGENTLRLDKDRLQDQCRHISLQERKAMTAERESIKYKQVEYLQNHIDTEFNGLVSGMIDRGIFVELFDSKCEGLVSFDTMNEAYEVAESRLRARGLRSGRAIKMGDVVKVRVTGTNLAKRQIEMELIEEE